MGASYEKREAADRRRTIKPRKQGNAVGPYRSYGLGIPAWLAREITGSDDPNVIEERMRMFEFSVEQRPEGILYTPIQIRMVEGWQEWDD